MQFVQLFFALNLILNTY